MTISRRLRRDLREILLIVVGVLIALTANAVWGYFQDRSHERTALHQIYETTVENERRISQAFYEDSMTFTYEQFVWRALQSPGARDSAAIAEALYRGFWFSDFNPLTGTFKSLSETGTLNVLRNEQLRARIATSGGELESFMAEWRAVADAASNTGIQLFPRFLPFHEINAWYYSDRRRPPPHIDYDALWSDHDYQSFLEFLILASANRTGLLGPLRDHTTQLRVALEKELGLPPAPAFVPFRTYQTGFAEPSKK